MILLFTISKSVKDLRLSSSSSYSPSQNLLIFPYPLQFGHFKQQQQLEDTSIYIMWMREQREYSTLIVSLSVIGFLLPQCSKSVNSYYIICPYLLAFGHFIQHQQQPADISIYRVDAGAEKCSSLELMMKIIPIGSCYERLGVLTEKGCRSFTYHHHEQQIMHGWNYCYCCN